MWKHRGQQRPPFAVEPAPGQESVWDYPRPPALEPLNALVEVHEGDTPVARSHGALRILETASPPTVYLPPGDVDARLLVAVEQHSHCEWKGRASYWALASAPGQPVAWSYAEPRERFRVIAGWYSFYPGRIRCLVDGEVVRPQGGGFYGGWVTDNLVGPWKGEDGTGGW